MNNRARTALTGIAGAVFGALALAVALGIWAAGLGAVVTVRGAWFPVLTGAISGFAGVFIGRLVGMHVWFGNAVVVLVTYGFTGLGLAYLEITNDSILHVYVVDFGVVLLGIGISTMIASSIAFARRR